MARSAEYPDLVFVEPRAWGSGRDGKAVRYIVVHYTAGAERPTSAEDGAAYDQQRTDGTSTHYFVDSNSLVQCVPTKDRANAARHRGNRLGIQYELCGTAQTRAQWLDAASLATLRNAARQMARDCRKYGIPVRRLSVAQTRACWIDFPDGPKGFVGHVDVTNAYPEDGGTHTDPGPDFPWDVLFRLVTDELEDDVTREELREELKAFFAVSADPDDSALTSKIGQDALSQGIPNPFRANRARGPAWVLFNDLADWLKSILAQSQSNGSTLSALASRPVVAAPDVAAALLQPLADAVVAGLVAAGVNTLNPEQITEAVKVAFRQGTGSA